MLSEETLVGIPWSVIFGFIRLMTHRRVLEKPLSVEGCCDFVEEWPERPNVQPLEPGPRHFSIFKKLLSGIKTGGDLVTDAHIAALAVEYSGELHSNDSDFSRFKMDEPSTLAGF